MQKRNEPREIVLLLARAARKLAAVYFPVYVFLLVAGREFIRVLFTARFADSWPIFAVNLTLLPLGIVLLDPLYRAFERERYFLLRLRLVLAAVLIVALWLFTARLGLLGVIAVVVAVAAIERAVMAIHFGRLLGVTARDVVLLRDIGKAGARGVGRRRGCRPGATVARTQRAHWWSCWDAARLSPSFILPLAMRWLPVPRLVLWRAEPLRRA